MAANEASSNGLHGSFKSVDCLVDEVFPSSYISRPALDKPCFSQVPSGQEIPVIDIAGLLGDRRIQVIPEIGRACEEWGCFQVIHHGVPQLVVERMLDAARKFHEQPPEEKKKIASRDLAVGVNYSSANDSTIVTNYWLDLLVIRRRPGHCDGFQEAPEIFKGSLLEYGREMQNLGRVLYDAIFESLGLSANYLKDARPEIDRVVLTVNFYPPCSDPGITSGFKEHTDVGTLTILLQDEVSGLQVRSKTGQWVTAEPRSDEFVVLLADQIEILTNGKYKSVEHRVATNTEKQRISLPFTFGPTEETMITPLSHLIDENHPAVYRGVIFGEYMKNYFGKNVPLSKKGLNYAKVFSQQEHSDA